MQFKDIIYEVKSDYAYVTINRPKVLNAFTPVTLQELKTALDSAEKDKNVGVYKNQPLVIINNGKATGKELLNFALNIKETIYNNFEIELEEEVIIM